jgi:hypothetical protein
MPASKLLIPLLIVVLAFAMACGGDDDDNNSAAGSSSGGASDAAPADNGDDASGDEDPDDDAAPPPDDSGGGDSVGFVTIGGETWNIVASIQCDVGPVGGVPLARVHGHAEGDESIEIEISFDPRDIGLQLAVSGADFFWDANDDAVTQTGGTHISGEGTFSSETETVEGSFDARC